MAFHRRKLLNPSEDTPEPCQPYCDGTKSDGGRCPPGCPKFCPYICLDPFPVLRKPPPPPPPPPIAAHPSDKPYRLSIFLTISLAVLAAAFFLFTCYTIYRFYSNWRNSRRSPGQPEDEDPGLDDFLDEDHEPVVDHPIWYIRTLGLHPSVISAITIVKYKKGEGLIEGTDCSVCLSEFQEDETVRLLPKCNHAFHIPCIDTWLRSHTNCPMCRAGIVSNTSTLPSQELGVRNPGSVDEARVGFSVSGSNREAENEASEVRIGIEDHNESQAFGEEEVNRDKGGLVGIQPTRRSVSVDSLSASMISAAIANAYPGRFGRNSDNQSAGVRELSLGVIAKRDGVNQRLTRSPSIERSIQTGSSSIKRSLSCSAKVLLSRYNSRNRNSDSFITQ